MRYVCRCQEKYYRNTLELQCIAERVYQGFESAIRVTEILKMYALFTHFIFRFLFSSLFYLLFFLISLFSYLLSNSDKDVPQVVQANESTACTYWHRVCFYPLEWKIPFKQH